MIPAIFYIVVLGARLDLTKLRENGWLFDIGAEGGREPWWKFYTYYGECLFTYQPHPTEEQGHAC